ncbi:uncharacterized protein LOC114523531 [Dendronephthya gigantea]|uniref:uncharacterized protein LOC114523531 n=1 Tax=Dendronephthya gigantea TaxID=151771 RepID=UPI00106C011F|nr:uncharacterized protein LOC114523531 [Dendronephthya gigantea]
MATAIDAESDGVSEEIELLQAIYVHEIELSGLDERPIVVNLFLHPSTGDDDHNSKYVCLNLCLSICGEYPFQSPGISIKNPRGISDAHLSSIHENLIALAKEKIGSPMLYDLIEYTKECLSDNNVPSCPCVICLEHFGKEENFVKTECYHYFHSVCLANYVKHFLSKNHDKKIVCPMCRLDIVYDRSENGNKDNSSCMEDVFVYKPDEKQLKAQAERQKIFEYQKQKGGIINIEEERNKYLIGIKNEKVKESDNSDFQSDGIPAPVTPGMLGKTKILPCGVSSQSMDQTCKEKITDEGKRNKKNTRPSKENDYSQSSDLASGRGKSEKRRDRNGQRRMQVGDSGNNGSNLARETKEPGVERSGFHKDSRRNDVKIRQNKESQKEELRRRTGCETNRGLDRPETQSKSKNFHSESDMRDRNLESTREGGDQHEELKKQPAKDEMPLNWRRKDGESQEREQGASKEQTSDVCPEERGLKKKDENDVKSNKTTSKPKTRNLKVTRKHTENEGSEAKNIDNNSTSRETVIKQTDKKQKYRRTPTPRKSHEGDKDPPVQRRNQTSFSSVASGIRNPREDATKIERISNSNDSLSFAQKKKAPKNSDASISRVEKTSSNDGGHVGNTMDGENRPGRDHQTLPGFENKKSDKIVGKHLKAEHLSGVTGHGRKPPRPPPGFENVKPNSKSL